MKGLAFSGDKAPGLEGENVDCFVGEAEGVVTRPFAVAGEAEFWRRKGDWRAVSWKERGRDMIENEV